MVMVLKYFDTPPMTSHSSEQAGPTMPEKYFVVTGLLLEKVQLLGTLFESPMVGANLNVYVLRGKCHNMSQNDVPEALVTFISMQQA